MKNTSRRSFLKHSAIAAAGAGLYSTASLSRAAVAPSDRINIGVVGLGFGAVNIRIMLEGNPNVHCTGLCDVDQTRLDEHSAKLKEQFPVNAGNIKLYTDFRKLLEDKDLDGVIVATPDHWHTYIYAEAIKAGKAVYVEKPVGKTIAECNLMVELQRKYENVVSTGLWHISVDYFTEAFGILKTGALGDVFKVHAWITGSTNPVTYSTEPQAIPPSLDYPMWLGPAPSRPFVSHRVRSWRTYWDYGGGRQTDWVHYLDSALDGIAALGHKRMYPKSISSAGYKHPDTLIETPSVQTSIFQFEDLHIVWEYQVNPLYGRGDGVAWIGSNGTLVCNRTGYEIIPAFGRDRTPLMEPKRVDGPYANQFKHMINWAECIRDNNTNTKCPIDKASYATILANIANISHRTGGNSLEYLPFERKFLNNSDADSFISPTYKNNWKFPRV